MIRTLNGTTPRVDPSAYVNELAYVVGDVEIGAGSSVWPCSVLRGDEGSIKVGRNTHIQDGSVVHAGRPMEIGSNINVGHSVVIHASKVGDRCLIGNNATLLEYVEIGDECLVAANSLVRVGTKVPSGSFVVGVPAEIRPLTETQRSRLGRVSRLADQARWFRESGL